MSWSELDKSQAENFLKNVADEKHPVLFEPSICEVYMLPLDFYEGYHLTRISNHYTIPYMQMDYLSNGEDHYYLDGSENAFHNLNARKALNLTQDNVFDYLSLYIAYVYERGNSLEFDDHREALSVAFDEQAQLYRITTRLIYKNQQVECTAEVAQDGTIHIKTPLAVNFLAELRPTADIDYTHEYQDSVIEGCKTLLAQTETGKKLLEIGEEYKPVIKIIPSPNYQGFCTNLRQIYMTMPAPERTGKYLQALILAGCLADLEQIMAGHTHPHPEKDEEIYGDANLGKNLDIVTEQCKIVEEWEKLDIPDGAAALAHLGLAGVYQGYRAGQAAEALAELYLDALIQKDIIG